MYRCRSAHKLLELDATYHIFEWPCRTVVDLAAAPGGFAQVALQRMACTSLPTSTEEEEEDVRPVVIAFDQRPIKPMEGLFSVICDVNDHPRVMRHTARLLQTLYGENDAQRKDVHVVLHDGVSVVKGQSLFSVTYGQNQMALGALRLAGSFFALHSHPPTSARRLACRDVRHHDDTIRLKRKFVTKAMHSSHFNTLLEACQLYFYDVHVHKPSECKPESLETYIVARGFCARRWLLEEKRAKGLHPHLSLPPRREDVVSGRQMMWRCWGCREVRLGTSPCPLCSARH
ncbi:FtsJ cell division protein, putative [Trypanosoma cruzi marinkellei]|uniref:FtsJ cell division protein, putative n=1 Tax=Trypanosoma cruzi marinkellei TaxID=85056 RepID=K2NT15_TRYCR|nr:FtsJ cell division protein, putative [Trypanosoma cruzi marinkellei]